MQGRAAAAGSRLARLYSPIESTFRLLRPEFWVVNVFPAWVGWVLARRVGAPDQDALLAAMARTDVAAVVDWAWAHQQVAWVLLLLGPLLGGSIMITNDYFDRQADVFNPKKVRSPLVAGTATPRRALILMTILVAATIVGGFLFSPFMGWLLVVGEGLSFAYSAPPLRLKARPLGDVLVNAFGYGGICTTIGWVLGGGGLEGFPLGPLLIVGLAIAAGYLPTVLMDHEADRQAGLRTTATTWGPRVAWLLGFEALVAANLLMLAMAAAGLYVGPRFILTMLPFMAVEVAAYVFLVRRAPPKDQFLGACFCTFGFFGNLAAFVAVLGFP